MKRKGVGPNALGSPFKQTDKPIKGGMLKEATVTAKAPTAIEYFGATEPKYVGGNAPMVGGAGMLGLTKGFNLVKSAVGASSKMSKVAKAAEVAGEAFDIYKSIKGRK